MKKFFKFLVAFAMVFSLMACGSKKDDDKKDDKVSEDDGAKVDKNKDKDKDKENKVDVHDPKDDEEDDDYDIDIYDDEEEEDEEPIYSGGGSSSQQTGGGNSSNTGGSSQPLGEPELVDMAGPFASQSEALATGNANVGQIRKDNNAKASSFVIDRDPSGDWMVYYYIQN